MKIITQFDDTSMCPLDGSRKLENLSWWKCFNAKTLSVSSREDVERRFEGKLSKNMSGSLYEMVSRVMKALVNRKITVPGNFQGSESNDSI